MDSIGAEVEAGTVDGVGVVGWFWYMAASRAHENALCRDCVEFRPTSSSWAQLLSCWLSMDGIWRPWCLQSRNMTCVGCVLVCAVVIRYMP